jgi:hypothetical protein
VSRKRHGGTKTRTGAEIYAAWREFYQPVVSTIANAAAMFGIDPAELERRVETAGLPVFTLHASGEPVFRWRALKALAKGQQR